MILNEVIIIILILIHCILNKDIIMNTQKAPTTPLGNMIPEITEMPSRPNAIKLKRQRSDYNSDDCNSEYCNSDDYLSEAQYSPFNDKLNYVKYNFDMEMFEINSPPSTPPQTKIRKMPKSPYKKNGRKIN
jgi:hypothetical protein